MADTPDLPDLEEFRGRKNDIFRHFGDLLGSEQQGRDTDEIVVTAHLHDEMTKKQAKRHTDVQTLRVGNITQHLAECPSFLDYGDYAAEMALQPSSMGTLSVDLGVDRHMVHCRT
jgi:hypothetical protein